MKKIYDSTKLDTYLEAYALHQLFDTQDLPFFLIQYKKGETIVHPLKLTEYLQFVVSGTVSVYSIRKDGSQYTLSASDDFTLLGDIEFIKNDYPAFFAEAQSEVTAVCLSMEKARKLLDKDVRFLHYLLHSLIKKIEMSSLNEAVLSSLEEKLMYYLQYTCPHNTLTNVGQAADYIHCSRRQLQRLLKKLTGEGTLSKIKKGCYRLSGAKTCVYSITGSPSSVKSKGRIT